MVLYFKVSIPDLQFIFGIFHRARITMSVPTALSATRLESYLKAELPQHKALTESKAVSLSEHSDAHLAFWTSPNTFLLSKLF